MDNEIVFVLSSIVGIATVLYAVHRYVNNEISSKFDLITKQIDKLANKIDDLSEALVELRTSVYGVSGNNGLSSRVREIQEDVKELRELARSGNPLHKPTDE